MGTHAGQRSIADLEILDVLAGVASSATGAEREMPATTVTDMFGDVEAAVRIRLELIARASASPQTALPHAINLLVDGPAEQRDAIVAAINGNEALCAQWQRAWSSLRR